MGVKLVPRMGNPTTNTTFKWFVNLALLVLLSATLGDSTDSFEFFNNSFIPFKRTTRRQSKFIVPDDSQNLFCEKSSPTINGTRCYKAYGPASWENALRICLDEGYILFCAQTKIQDREKTASILFEAQRRLRRRIDFDAFRRIWALDDNCRIPGGDKEPGMEDQCQCLWFQDINTDNPNYMFQSSSCQAWLPFICETEGFYTTTTSKTVTPYLTTTLMPPTKIQPSTKIPPTAVPPDAFYCENQTAAGIVWPRVPWGATVIRPCAPPLIGNVSWYCDLDTKGWYPDTPDLSHCSSPDFYNILKDISDDSNVETVVNQLVNVTSGGAIVGGDVIVALDILDEIKDLFRKESQDTRRETAVTLTTGALTAGSNLLMDTNIWKELPKESRRDTGSKFLNVIEEFGFLLTENINITNQTVESSNIGMQVLRKKRTNSSSPVILPFDSGLSGNKTAQLILPKNFEANLPPDIETRIVFIKYYQLDQVLLVEETEQDGFNVTKNTQVNSPVVSTTLNSKSTVIHMDSKVEIILQHLDPHAERPVCTFWSETTGTWNSSGCSVDYSRSNDSYTVCLCDHLTNFAVLMDVTGYLDPQTAIALSYVTIVGCSISIFCLSLCIFIFTFFRSLWSITTTIHRNLCICLLFGELLLLFGIDRTENRIVCSVIAGCLHYTFLAAFTWMFLEGVQLYFMLIRVFIPKRNYILRYYGIGYGVPLAIVGITAAVKPNGYGSEFYCWLTYEDGAIWSFVGPVIGVIALNLVALVMALWSSTRVSSAKHDTFAITTKKLARGGLALVFILGLTWILGLLQIADQKVMAFVFAVTNSLQGLGIFVFYCVIHDKTRHVVFGWLSKSVTGGFHLSFRTTLSSKRFSNTTTTSRISSDLMQRAHHVNKPPSSPLALPIEGKVIITSHADNVVL